MLKKEPKISIVTPSFNQGEFLEDTILSVLEQDYPNLEYIIMDGGSTDNSCQIIKKYSNNLHYWVSEKDKGHYDAVNKGFEKSTGEIMAWLNSDDMYCPWALKTVADIFSNLPDVNWITTLNPGYWDYRGFCIGFKNSNGISKDAFLDGCYLPLANKFSIGWIQQESTFWRRTLWDKVGHINTEYELAGDFALWAEFFKYDELYGIISPLGGFRLQHKSRSKKIDSYIVEAETALSLLREVCGWSRRRKRYREIIYGTKLVRIPKLRNVFLPMINYRGKKIIRKEKDNPNGYWAIEEYTFY